MRRYTNDELRAVLAGGESDRVEFKSAWTRPVANEARETVCAFGNDLTSTGEPGILVVGARDDGSGSGINVDDFLLLQLNGLRTDGNIVPPPSLYVERRVLDGDQYAIVVVEPSDSPPVRYDGRIHVRTGPRRDIATAQDERMLGERRRAGDLPDDQLPVRTAKLEDIDRARFAHEYLPRAFAYDVLQANERTTLQRLTSLKLVSPFPPHHPTLAGCLTLVDDPMFHVPGAYIQFLRIRGASLADPKIDEARGLGHAKRALETVEGRLHSWNAREVDYGNTPKERSHVAYPLEALHELLRNAVMHRTYFGANAPVRVYWYDDRGRDH